MFEFCSFLMASAFAMSFSSFSCSLCLSVVFGASSRALKHFSTATMAAFNASLYFSVVIREFASLSAACGQLSVQLLVAQEEEGWGLLTIKASSRCCIVISVWCIDGFQDGWGNTPELVS